MAKITKKDVEYVAALAHISLDDEAKAGIVKDLDEILVYMEKLNELDTDSVEPMMRVQEATNVMRDDVVGESLDQAQALKNAPSTDGEYFLVPRVLDGE